MRKALAAAASTCRRRPGTSSSSVGDDRADELEAQGLVVRRRPGRFGSPSGSRPRTTGSSPRSARRPRRRDALGARRQDDGRDRAARSRSISTARPDPRRHGIGFLDHLLAQLAFHGGLDLEIVAGGDLDVDEHHTVEDVMAALGDALGQALDGRAASRATAARPCR
jgi:hypothetical protein